MIQDRLGSVTGLWVYCDALHTEGYARSLRRVMEGLATSSLLSLLRMRMSRVLKPHAGVGLQFSETCVHHGPHGLRRKDQLRVYRKRAYRDLALLKQVEGGTYSSTNCITQPLAVSRQSVIVHDRYAGRGM